MKRAQCKHGLIDVDFFGKAPVRALKARFGHISQLCYVEILLCMSGATLAVIDEDALDSIIADYPIKDPKGFKAYLIEKCLIQAELNGFSNSRVIKDQESYAVKNKKGVEIPADSGGKVRQSPEDSGEKTRIPVYVYDTDHVFDLIKELDTPQIRAEVNKFAAKIIRDSNGKRQLHQQTLDNWQSEYRADPARFLDDLKFSNGLVSCWNLKRRGAVPQQQESSKDTLNRLMREALTEEQNAEN